MGKLHKSRGKKEKTKTKRKKKHNSLRQIEILDGSVGNSYESLFGRYLDGDVTSVLIEDPYIRKHYQIVNLLRFMELILRNCPNIRSIHLKTGPDSSSSLRAEQNNNFDDISSQFKSFHKIEFTYEFSESLHDRQIKLSTGWVIKIGRGLDLYKSCKSIWTPGYHDMDLRPCLQTTIDIFHGDLAKRK